MVGTFTGQSVGRDPRQSLTTHVAVGRPRVGTGVPVVHPGEVVHAVLGRLQEGHKDGKGKGNL